MNPHNVALGRALRELRSCKQLSQEQLAFDAGLDRTYISLLELGRKSPTLDTIAALCSALDVSLPDFAARIESAMGDK